MAISEWDQRQLCPDGTCIGVIGPEGTCKVCGRVAPDWGDERRRGLVAPEGEEAASGEAGAEDQDELSPSAPAVLGEVAPWQRRQLCADGGCVGVIGPDGHCKVCGKAASGEDDEGDEEDEDDEEDEGDEEDEDEDESEDDAAEAAAAPESPAADGEVDDRRLCPDGACIGVIGSDGHCKVCGKEAA